MKRVLNIALVGCGRISKRHVDAINNNKNLKIVGVCDIDADKATELSTKLKVPYVTKYTDLNKIWYDIDIVSVLTPSGMHPRHCTDISHHINCRHIVCEKPIALTCREAIEMSEIIKKNKKILIPVYQNRYNPIIKTIKEIIDLKILGQLYHFTCNIYWNRNDEYYKDSWHGTSVYDGGVLFTQASHYMDMLLYLFGNVEKYNSVGGNIRGKQVFDTVSCSMSFINGVVGSLNATNSVCKSNFNTEFNLFGEKGTICLDGTNLNNIKHWDVCDVKKPKQYDIKHIYGNGHDILYKNIRLGKYEEFPNIKEVIYGIKLMENLSLN